MSNSYFQFKQFIIHQDKCAMKVTTDGCLFGAWVAEKIGSQESEVRTALDIGTGTGLLSLMLAQKNSNLYIDAIEIDKEAAEQAAENIAASPWADRIQVHYSDAKKFQSSKSYDLIISNPPFYENELKSGKSQKNIAHHSDELQLNELLDIIKYKLSPEGIFCLLLPFKRNEEIKKKLFQAGLIIQMICFVKQSVTHDYFRIMLMGKLRTTKPIKTLIDEIPIKDDLLTGQQTQYSSVFTKLLLDYYLHLF
jgi:tRNA1Val (adenine37-N6)-methyltransferase